MTHYSFSSRFPPSEKDCDEESNKQKSEGVNCATCVLFLQSSERLSESNEVLKVSLSLSLSLFVVDALSRIVQQGQMHKRAIERVKVSVGRSRNWRQMYGEPFLLSESRQRHN